MKLRLRNKLLVPLTGLMLLIITIVYNAINVVVRERIDNSALIEENSRIDRINHVLKIYAKKDSCNKLVSNFKKVVADLKLKESESLNLYEKDDKGKLSQITGAKMDVSDSLLSQGKKKMVREKAGNYFHVVFPITNPQTKSTVGVVFYKHDISEIRAIANSAKYRVITIVFTTFIFVILVVLVITHIYISKPINMFIRELENISRGNYSKQIIYLRRDELGKLSNQINGTLQALNKTINAVNSSVRETKNVSIQLSNTSQQIAEGSSEEAASVEQILSSMEQMSANIEQNVSNAKKTEKEIYLASAAVYEGNKSVGSTAELIANMEEKLNIINEIAKQTNILALNASVEAATAGSFGKGFAVIAREIRELSEITQNAAVEIQAAINKSVAVSTKANSQLSDIVVKMENTSTMVKQIVTSSLEQESGVTQVKNGMQQLNNVTQKNAAIAEEMTSIAQEFSAHSEKLLNSIEANKNDNVSNLEEETIIDNDLNKNQAHENENEGKPLKNNIKGFDIELDPESEEFEMF